MTDPRSRVVLAGLLACTAATATEAAGPQSTVEPTRVRVTAADRRLSGDLVSLDATTLVLQEKGQAEPEAIPLSSIRSIERRVRPSQKRRGLVMGLLIGAAAGAVAGYASGSDCDRGGYIVCFERESTAAGGAVAFGVLGMAVGGLVAPGEKWETATRDGLRLDVRPESAGGVSVRLSWSF